jgi:hypothetical protein
MEALRLSYFIAKAVNDFSDYLVLVLLIFPGKERKKRPRIRPGDGS